MGATVASPDDAHHLPVEELARALATDAALGLTDAEAGRLREEWGPNALPLRTRPRYARIVARQFADPLVLLLVAAAGVSVGVGEGVDAAVIAAIVLLNAGLGFFQEASAERAVIALRDTLQRHALVVRDGEEREVAVEELVPGDLLVIHEGDRVPADARLVEAHGLAADESALTGESVPSDKSSRPVGPDAPLAERSSLVFAGTAVTRGRARALVTATGPRAQIGRVAALTSAARPPRTPLQERLTTLTRYLVAAGLAITACLTAAELLRGAAFDEAFLVGVSVAVAAVPEGLAAIVTIALALGARRMAERGAIVRRLAAVETLGSATVVAADKTGTLTRNELRLHSVAPAAGYDTGGVLLCAVMASTAGDPVDGAIRAGAAERGATVPPSVPVVELTFDAERRRMTLVYPDGEGGVAYTKGAPEVVLALCGEDAREERGRLEELAARWAADGLRVLAIARRDLPGPVADDPAEVERELDPVGLVALHDPLRESAPAAVGQARAAGLGVRILTGDHPATAHAVATSLEIPESAVAARVAPADKLRIVEELQRGGDVVAVTGDGVNDAPALRRADVGVSMGRSGTEAAREASDLVLTDDDFATIVAAIREGRAIGDNIRKFVAFLLSANLGEVLVFAAAVFGGLGPPMTVVQILLVNVLTDGLPAIALARDPAAPDVMERMPARRAQLFDRRTVRGLALIGGVVGASSLAAFVAGGGADSDAARTMTFATLALSELGVVFAIRSARSPAWRSGRNPWLIWSVLAAAAIVVVVLAAPGLRDAFGTVSLSSGQVATVIALALVPLAVTEAAKARRRARRA